MSSDSFQKVSRENIKFVHGYWQTAVLWGLCIVVIPSLIFFGGYLFIHAAPALDFFVVGLCASLFVIIFYSLLMGPLWVFEMLKMKEVYGLFYFVPLIQIVGQHHNFYPVPLPPPLLSLA